MAHEIKHGDWIVDFAKWNTALVNHKQRGIRPGDVLTSATARPGKFKWDTNRSLWVGKARLPGTAGEEIGWWLQGETYWRSPDCIELLMTPSDVVQPQTEKDYLLVKSVKVIQTNGKGFVVREILTTVIPTSRLENTYRGKKIQHGKVRGTEKYDVLKKGKP